MTTTHEHDIDQREADEAEAAEEIRDSFDIRTHNGEITVVSTRTGDHRTFRIRTQPDDAKFAPGMRVVSLLTGPDNTADYQGFGFVTESGIRLFKSKATDTFRAFARILERIHEFREQGKIVAKASGRCRRCNRLLTDPISIDVGMGPTCRKAAGLEG